MHFHTVVSLQITVPTTCYLLYLHGKHNICQSPEQTSKWQWSNILFLWCSLNFDHPLLQHIKNQDHSLAVPLPRSPFFHIFKNVLFHAFGFQLINFPLPDPFTVPCVRSGWRKPLQETSSIWNSLGSQAQRVTNHTLPRKATDSLILLVDSLSPQHFIRIFCLCGVL